MTMVAHVVDAVVGIDTHRDFHEVELADPHAGVLARTRIDNTSSGFTDLVAWINEHSPGPRLVIAVEGTRSYGIGVTRALSGAGFTVIEAEQPKGKDRRGRGKTDAIDAHLGAVFALRQDPDRLPTPRADGIREALRILLRARDELATTTTGQTNRLRALLLSGPDTDRAASRETLPDTVLSALARRGLPTDADRYDHVRQHEIGRLATAIRDARKELRANRKHLAELLTEIAPHLCDLYGVGPISAAQVVISYSHPGRVRDEAAFAALAGTAPIPASSGKTTRHRLNRGGDRALNRAIHTIALTRMRGCDRTRTYVQRRQTEGKTTREIRRCLKRYITRELYRTLTPTA